MPHAASELPLLRRLGEALLLACLLSVLYFGAGARAVAYPLASAHHLDAMIPFTPQAVWLYLPGYAGSFLLTLWAIRDPRHYRAALTAVGTLTVLALPFFLWFPIAAPRPAAPVDPSATAALVRWLFAHDPVGNTFPSLHVANATACAAICTASNKRWGAVAWVLALAVAASVVLLKQHWLVDVPGGWILAAAGVGVFRAQLAAPTVLAALPARLMRVEPLRPLVQRVWINGRVNGRVNGRDRQAR